MINHGNLPIFSAPEIRSKKYSCDLCVTVTYRDDIWRDPDPLEWPHVWTSPTQTGSALVNHAQTPVLTHTVEKALEVTTRQQSDTWSNLKSENISFLFNYQIVGGVLGPCGLQGCVQHLLVKSLGVVGIALLVSLRVGCRSGHKSVRIPWNQWKFSQNPAYKW